MHSFPLTLEDVFSFWQANEAWNPKWQRVAYEKGFFDWESWQRKFLDRLAETTEEEWRLELVEKPLEEIPKWYRGPFRGWIENVYDGKSAMLFRDIICQPFINGHDYVLGLVTRFPKLTVLTVVEESEGRVIVVEGMHRACALTLLFQQGKKHEGLVFVARGKLKNSTKLTFDIQAEKKKKKS